MRGGEKEMAGMVEMEALSPEKRAQILNGAATVFAQDGYEGASMSRIACEASVSKGTLYNHFESKADLFAAYVQQECRNKLSHVFGAIDRDGDPAETLRRVARRMLELMVSPGSTIIYRVVIAEACKFPHLARAFYEAGPAAAMQELSRWLDGEVKRGRLVVDDPDFAAEQFLALCQTKIGLRRRLMLEPVPDEAEFRRVVDATVDMFLRRYGA